MRTRRKKLAENALVYGLLIAASMTVILPVLWMFSTALKTEQDVFSYPPKWVTDSMTWDAFIRIWTDYPFLNYFANSLIVVTLATAVSVFFSLLAGYGVSRFHFRGKGAFMTFLLVTQMFPSIMLLIPFYKIMTNLNLVNTLIGLVLTYISFTIPFCSWMMMGYFNTIPRDLDEAAYIDGCGKFRTFWNIVMPLTLPGIAATSIYAFIVGWNEYMFAQVLISNETMKTVPIGIGQLIGYYRIVWNDLMAAALVATIPLSLVFLVLQKYLISGLTAGAVKS